MEHKGVQIRINPRRAAWIEKIIRANRWEGTNVTAIDIIDLALIALAAQQPEVIRDAADRVLEPSLIAISADVRDRMRADVEVLTATPARLTEREMWAACRENYYALVVLDTDAASVAAQKMRLARAVFRDWVKALS